MQQQQQQQQHDAVHVCACRELSEDPSKGYANSRHKSTNLRHDISLGRQHASSSLALRISRGPCKRFTFEELSFLPLERVANHRFLKSYRITYTHAPSILPFAKASGNLRKNTGNVYLKKKKVFAPASRCLETFRSLLRRLKVYESLVISTDFKDL